MGGLLSWLKPPGSTHARIARKLQEENFMREMTADEIMAVAGGGVIGEAWDDIKRIASELPEFYETLINSTTDMMCTATSNC